MNDMFGACACAWCSYRYCLTKRIHASNKFPLKMRNKIHTLADITHRVERSPVIAADFCGQHIESIHFHPVRCR